MAKITYSCERCGKKYPTEHQADECANQNHLAYEIPDWTVVEKARAFDDIQKMCISYLRNVEKNCQYSCDSDEEHYIFEESMQQTLGKNVFDHMNRSTR